MNKVISFVRLDLYTLKPYKKFLYFYMGIGLFMGIVFKSVSILSSIFMFALLLIMAYPFSISEKNGMDTLYATLSVNRRNVVMGRYGFVLCMEIIFTLCISLLAILLSTFFPMDITMSDAFISLSVLSMVFSLIVSLQYPIYFKFGYTKAKTLANIPMLIIFLAIGILPSIAETTWAFDRWNTLWQAWRANPVILYGLPVVIGIILLAVSCFITCKLYEKRDL